MKKYLFGLFAIVLAVSFSAFTNAKKITKTFVQYENWYETDGVFVTGILYHGEAIDREELAELPAAAGKLCEGEVANPCVRGSDDEVDELDLLPSAGTDSDFFKD
jgi:hypothetical protein